MDKLFIGFVLGIFFIMVATEISDGSYHSMAKRAKQDCEKHLPRFQECVVIALPVEKYKLDK